MAWVEAQQALRENPKTKRLARTLGIPRPQAIGHLFCLWWWALDYAEEGNLSAHDAEDVADGADWKDDPDQFWEALVKAGWVEPDGKLHDWENTGGKYITARNKGRKRQKDYRAEKQDKKEAKAPDNAAVTRDKLVTNADVTRDSLVTDEPVTRDSDVTGALSRVSHSADMTLRDATSSDVKKNDVMPPQVTPRSAIPPQDIPGAQGEGADTLDPADPEQLCQDFFDSSGEEWRTGKDWREVENDGTNSVSIVNASSHTPMHTVGPLGFRPGQPLTESQEQFKNAHDYYDGSFMSDEFPDDPDAEQAWLQLAARFRGQERQPRELWTALYRWWNVKSESPDPNAALPPFADWLREWWTRNPAEWFAGEEAA